MAKILVVDDLSQDRNFLAKMLTFQKHEVLEASDGADALNQISTAHPDLVVTDLFMPQVDGFDLVRRLRGQKEVKDTPVVFYTANYLAPQVAQLAHRLGVQHVLNKPAQPKELVEIIHDVLPVPGQAVVPRRKSQEIRAASIYAKQLDAVNARWEAMIAYNLELSEETDPLRLLHSACGAARRLIGVRYAFIVAANIYAPDQRIYVANGMDRKSAISVADFLENQRLFDRLISAGRSYRIVYHVGDLPFADGIQPSNANFGLVATPIVCPSRAYGWLCLIDPIGGEEFTGADEHLATIISAQVGRTYENCSLFAESQRHSHELNKEITVRKRAEHELDRFFTQSPSPLGLLGFDGRYIRVNPAHEAAFGYSAVELKTIPFMSLVHPEDQDLTRAEIRRLAAGQERVVVENRIRCKDGAYRTMIWTATPFLDQNGFYATGYDITERKKLEQQLLQAQKMEAIGALAGGVAHDFNNLLTIINGYGDILLGQIAPDHPLHEFVHPICKAGQRAASLTRQLLLFSRKQICVPVALDLNMLLNEMEKMLARLIGEDIQLRFEVEPELWRAKVDLGQMEQVVMNLVVNARDAMPNGGRIVISAANVQLETDCTSRPADLPAGAYIRLTVADSGTGMNEATRQRIFEPFFTTKGPEKGTGLGLATVYGIVKQSNGHIEVDSEIGVGTTFTIYLPKAGAEVSEIRPAPKATPVRQGVETILFVEDDDAVRSFACLVLERKGYHVLAARDGADALKVASQHMGRIDLIATDMVMPAMGGRELAMELTKIQPEIRLLYMSGYTDSSIAGTTSLDPETPFLQKPYTPELLTQKVRSTLDGPPARFHLHHANAPNVVA